MTTEQADRAIREVYTGPVRYGAIARVGRELGLSSSQMYHRAMRMGLLPAHAKATPWSKAELELLDDTAHLAINTAVKSFQRAGHKRTWSAIQFARIKHGFLGAEAREAVGLWTTTQLAQLIGVDDDTVRRWVTLYGLKAETRGDENQRRYLIAEKDLRRWIASNATRVHPGRVPHASWQWFVTMLSGLEPRHTEP